MRGVVNVIQIVISILLIGLILIQARGTGFGRSNSFGGSSSFSKRGLEKLIFRLTFIVVSLFLIVAIISLLI
ncbi:MAG: Preprotein translocase, SecG subunit [Candidatus Woesebacteria bacterium GW2011_GWA2_40_7b]|uniref:Protein-export membrane protein SecG n=1 Tax=Candidatus Woesebacteria bacterium GW2011_GWA2_40_7b TaxID=1618563 RepID=A0A0G0T8Q0_9BACT|nr:MAG: Preprotein translocase, SecG subunit [Candidatus Woesebacteria bacterium GW2011_GWA2_40_7b]